MFPGNANTVPFFILRRRRCKPYQGGLQGTILRNHRCVRSVTMLSPDAAMLKRETKAKVEKLPLRGSNGENAWKMAHP